jgi:hypothetical protein
MKAVGKDGKTSGEDGDDSMSELEGSAPVVVNVEPGVGEGGTVEITRLVTVCVGSLAGLESVGVGESELVTGGWEVKEESGGLEDEMVGGGKDELGSTVNKLGVGEGGDAEEESEGLEGEMVRGEDDELGSMVNEPGVDVGVIVLFVEEERLELGSVMEDDGVEDEDMLGEIEDTELELITDEDTVEEDDSLELDGDTVEDDEGETVEDDDRESVELELRD